MLQDLDSYGPEITSCCVLNNLSLGDLYAARIKVQKFLNDLDNVIKINEE